MNVAFKFINIIIKWLFNSLFEFNKFTILFNLIFIKIKKALKSSPSRKRNQFKPDPKRGMISEESQTQIATSPSNETNPIVTTSNQDSYNKDNLKKFKPIDSQDSIVNMIVPATPIVASNSKAKTNRFQPEFTNLAEVKDTEEEIRIHKQESISELSRAFANKPSITPIRNNYVKMDNSPSTSNRSNLIKNNQISSSSISIKIETHSPIQLKSSTNLLKDPTVYTKTSYSTQSSPKTPKFNGN